MFNFKKKNKGIISIEIGSYYVKFVLGKFKDGTVVVDKMIKLPLSKGVYYNGTIKDDIVFSSVIASGIKQLNTNVKDVIISLESSEILKREIQIPKVDDADLQGLIDFEVSQYLPIELSDYVIQYQIISSEVVDEKEKLNALIVAMPRSMAVYYFEMLIDLKLNPISMELSGNNIIKLIQNDNDSSLIGNTVAIVDLGYSSADLIILENGINKLSRYLQVGFIELDKFIFDNYDIDYEKAHEMMVEYQDIGIKQLIKVNQTYQDLMLGGRAESGDQIIEAKDLSQSSAERMEIIEEMINHSNQVLDELDKVFKYFTFKERGRKIDKIILLGGHSRIKDFDQLIEEKLGIETVVIDKNRLASVNFNCSSEEIQLYIAAIGGLIA